jgi:hypothetical protein
MVEFEHALFQILILLSLLNSKPPQQKYTLYFIAIGILIVFLPPVAQIYVPWNLLLGFILPLLLWHNARRLLNAMWRGKWKALFLWVIAATLFGLMLAFTQALELPGAVLFGLILASMIWRVGESEETSSFISQIGPTTLIFLLLEVDSAILSPSKYLGGIFSGVSLGVLVGLIAVNITSKLNPRGHTWISIGQIYIAYGVALLVGVSAVTASLASVLVYVTLGLVKGFWPRYKIQPMPLNTWFGFIPILILFLLSASQVHQPISKFLILEVCLGCGIGLVIAWIGRRQRLPSFTVEGSIWQIGFRVVLLLSPALLLWPRGILLQPVFLAIALGIAGLVLASSRMILNYLFDN